MSEGKSGFGAKNCVVYGCATMLVMGVVVMLIAFFGARYGYRKLVDNYTSPTPTPMPAVQLAPNEIIVLTNRLEAFKLEALTNTSELTFSLDANEINALLNTLPELAPYKSSLSVGIKEDVIKAQISLPLDALNLSALKGKFLNGNADIKASVINGKFDVRLSNLEVNGNKASGAFMTQLQNDNLAQDLKLDPNAQRVLERVESIKVEQGRVVIKVKPSGSSNATNAPPKGTI